MSAGAPGLGRRERALLRDVENGLSRLAYEDTTGALVPGFTSEAGLGCE